jgi:hypothetical protein
VKAGIGHFYVLELYLSCDQFLSGYCLRYAPVTLSNFLQSHWATVVQGAKALVKRLLVLWTEIS